MDSIDEFYRTIGHENTEAIEMKKLVSRWCRKVNNLPKSKLQDLKLWKEIYQNIELKTPLTRSATQSRIEYNFSIKKLKFIMNYKTDFGFSVVMIGSSDVLGKWSPDKAYKLTWTEGNNWKAILAGSRLGDEFEYKYAIQNTTTAKVQRWEGKENRKVSIGKLKEYLNSPEIASSILQMDEYNFSYRERRMAYVKNEEMIIICDLWQS